MTETLPRFPLHLKSGPVPPQPGPQGPPLRSESRGGGGSPPLPCPLLKMPATLVLVSENTLRSVLLTAGDVLCWLSKKGGRCQGDRAPSRAGRGRGSAMQHPRNLTPSKGLRQGTRQMLGTHSPAETEEQDCDQASDSTLCHDRRFSRWRGKWGNTTGFFPLAHFRACFQGHGNPLLWPLPPPTTPTTGWPPR